MNISVEKNSILGPVSRLVNITEKRSLMPVLANVLIVANNNKTTIYATDLEISAAAYADLPVDGEMRILVHGRKFMEILREMDSGEIALEVNDNTFIIRQKQTEFVLGLQDPEEFPEVKEIKGKEEFNIDDKVLLEMIDKVSFAVSTDETRYVLTGVFLEGKEGKLRVVGTDGFRMALCRKDVENMKDFKGVIVPKRSLVEVQRMFENEGRIRIAIDEKHVQFSSEKVTFISRILEGSFPDYENVVPANKNVAVAEKEQLLKGLKKVSTIIGRTEPIKVAFSPGTMVIEAESDMGRAKEIIGIQYEGEEMTMNFNVRFIMDVVQHIGEEKVCIKAPSTYGAVLLDGEGNEWYKNIIMPIRV
jgi:DNA polymerase-3 subunit beta